MLQGHGAPAYLNIEMPFALHPPDVPADNPTGVYRQSFRVPTTWRKRRTLVRIGSADALALVWVNGTFVGLGKDSRLPSSFDISDHLRRGVNDLAIVVPRWSDASWIEDQDQWWLPGLHRRVELVSVPTTAIADAGLVPGLDVDGTTGTVTIDVSVDAPRDHRELTVEVVVEGDRRRVVGRLRPDAGASLRRRAERPERLRVARSPGAGGAPGARHRAVVPRAAAPLPRLRRAARR